MIGWCYLVQNYLFRAQMPNLSNVVIFSTVFVVRTSLEYPLS